MKLAQAAAPQAICRLIELMDGVDERVAVVACNAAQSLYHSECYTKQTTIG
jgi:hypothetical protein